MDYKEKYEKALVHLKKFVDGDCVCESEILADFPELSESEDERIIRCLKEIVEWGCSKNIMVKCGVDLKAVKTWLERQKENSLSLLDAWKEMRTEVFAQASGNKPKPESDEFTKLFSLNDIDFLISDLDSRGIKQKPVEWHPEDEQNLNVCLSYIKDEPLRSWLIDAIHVRYDNPAEWSEEDEKKLNDVIQHLKVAYSPCDWLNETIDWLKSRRSQSKQEWSEEDKKMLSSIIMFLAGFMGNEEKIDFLKSLRPSWKPSEEQMKRLADAVESWRGGIGYNELKSLYIDLQTKL